jgi:hypothetical protein
MKFPFCAFVPNCVSIVRHFIKTYYDFSKDLFADTDEFVKKVRKTRVITNRIAWLIYTRTHTRTHTKGNGATVEGDVRHDQQAGHRFEHQQRFVAGSALVEPPLHEELLQYLRGLHRLFQVLDRPSLLPPFIWGLY